MKRSRAELAGRLLGRAIRECINLFYQRNTARNFRKGLWDELGKVIAEEGDDED